VKAELARNEYNQEVRQRKRVRGAERGEEKMTPVRQKSLVENLQREAPTKKSKKKTVPKGSIRKFNRSNKTDRF